MSKQKTTTSNEVKARWKAKAYKEYHISLRYDTDDKIIQYVEDNKKEIGTTEIFRQALKTLLEVEGNK